MKIAFNPSTVAALTTPPNNKDITFDLRGQNIFARGVKFCGTDTNTWRDIKINNISIGSNILDLRNSSNTTLTNANGVVTINSTWRPVVDNLTSNSTTSSLSANQGRILAGLINGKSDSDHNHDGRYVKRSGDTMLGALNFANGTWNLVGDDSYIGDCNVSGHLGIKAANTTYPGIAFFNNSSTFLGNLTAYSGNIKYESYSLQFLDNGNTSVKASAWTNPFSNYNSNAVADGQAICVWGQSSYLSNLANDTGDMSLWLRRGNAKLATLNMVLDGEYYANGNQRLAHVSEIPTSLKNPYSLTTFGVVYDGSTAKVVSPSNFISQVTEGTSTITDGTMFITSYASNSGFADTNAVNVPYKRKAIHLWEYIKAKTDSLYATKSHNHDDRYLKLIGGTLTGNLIGTSAMFSGRFYGSMDDEGIIIKPAANGYAGLILGAHDGERSVFYFIKNKPFWRYSHGSDNLDIMHPKKSGTIALTSDIPNKNSWNYDDRYLKLTGGTMLLGEGLKFHANDNYFGTNADARIISLLDSNDKICDGGLIIDERATLDGKEYVTELLRIRDSEFKWRGADILHSGNYSSILDSRYYTESEVNSLLSNKLNTSNFNWTNLPGKIVSNNEFNVVNAGYSNTFWFNYLPINDRNNKATIGTYCMGNGQQGYTSVTASGFIKKGSNSSYVLLGDGGHAAISSLNVASASKLQTPRSIWGQSFDGTRDVNGTIYINNSDSSNGAIRLNNNVNSNARISAIDNQVIFNTGSALRFGETSWDWNQWAGLKYTHSNKTIYLGIADKSIFNANSAQGGGTLNLRAGISNIDLNSGTSIRGLPTNGSPYVSYINLYDTSISLTTYGNISMQSSGPGTLKLTTGYGSSASISSDIKIESSRGVYLNSGNSGNVYLCQGGGKVGIGTTSPTQKLDVSGNIRATGQIIREGSSRSWVQGRNGALLRETTSTGYHALWSLKTTNGSWDFGEYNNSGWNNVPVLSYITDSNYNSGNNTTTYQIKFPLASGTLALTSNIPNKDSWNYDDRYVRAFGTSNDNIDSDWGQSFKTFDPTPSGTPPEQNPNISILNIGEKFNRRKQLAFTWNNDNIYYRRHVDNGFSNWVRLALINDVNNYYWANVKISTSSSTTTSPTVSNLTATNSIRMSNILLEHTDEINNSTNGGIHLNYRNSGNVSLCQGGGNVGVGTVSPSYKLDVSGQIRAGGFHHGSVNSNNYILLAGGGYKSYGGDDSTPIFLGYLNLDHGNDGTVSSSFYCLGYSVPFTYTRGGNYCRISIPDTTRLSFYINAAIASVHYSGGGMDTWAGYHRGSGAWWLHCYASGWNEVRVKGFRQANDNNDSWWGGNPLWSGNDGANRITVCIFGHVRYK